MQDVIGAHAAISVNGFLVASLRTLTAVGTSREDRVAGTRRCWRRSVGSKVGGVGYGCFECRALRGCLRLERLVAAYGRWGGVWCEAVEGDFIMREGYAGSGLSC